ncbi:MAG: helix-turn-helix domain-containing protein [Prevotella sp.]
MITSFTSSVLSYHRAQCIIENDLNKALELTLAQMPGDVINADTIRCYRNNLTITELKDTAYIAIKTVRRGKRQETELIAEANCSFLTIFKLSDQTTSGTLLSVGILWMIASLWYIKRYKPELGIKGLTYGGITFINNRFLNSHGRQIQLTPMQHSLLEMFMQQESHSLSKQEICERLWPKKPDATDTLYTLIRRIKPVIEANSRLKITSDRGKSYSLESK